MTLIKRENSFGTLFSNLFDDFLPGIETRVYNYPKTNMSEDEENYRVDICYPGLKKENFKIKVQNKLLKISYDLSEKKEEKSDKYYHKEFVEEGFNKSFILPDEVVKNKIKAIYQDGVLKVLIPKDKTKEKQLYFDVEIE